MKLSDLSTILALAPAFALGFDEGEWKPPGHGDGESSLAESAPYLADIITVSVLDRVLNWDVSVVSELFDFAQPTNPAPNATTFDLDHLTTHNILEHDGSISRQDAEFGPADVFHPETWNLTSQYFEGDMIDLAMAAKARTAAVVRSAMGNPQFTLPQLGAHFIYGETAAYQFVLGEWDLQAEEKKDRLLTPEEYVQYFFQNERLPHELGWKKPENRLKMDILQEMVFNIQAVTMEQMKGSNA